MSALFARVFLLGELRRLPTFLRSSNNVLWIDAALQPLLQRRKNVLELLSPIFLGLAEPPVAAARD